MHLHLAKRQSGLSLLELIVTTTLMATLATGMMQFIVAFYRYRLVDGVTSVLLAQTSRIQTEFQYYCNNATSIQMYGQQANRPQPGTSPSSLTTGNYFEATFAVEKNGDAANPTVMTRGIEYAPAQNAFKIYSYDTTGKLVVPPNGGPNPTVLGLSRITYQSGDQWVFGFRNHVPYLEFASMLPIGGPQGGILTATGESFNVTAYAKPYYTQ